MGHTAQAEKQTFGGIWYRLQRSNMREQKAPPGPSRAGREPRPNLCGFGEQLQLPFSTMIDSLIHHAAEALTVVVGLIAIVHEALPFLRRAKPEIKKNLRPYYYLPRLA
jgi:hypothetical protein